MQIAFALMQAVDESSPAYQAGRNMVFAVAAVIIIVTLYLVFKKKK